MDAPVSSLLRAVAFGALTLGFAAHALADDLRGHGGPVRALAVNAGLVYSGSFDTRSIVWEGERARQVTRAHDSAVTAVLPLPGGGFASGGQDGHIAIWDDGPEPLRFEQWHDLPVAAMAPWGDGFASAAWDGTIALWNGQDTPEPFQAHNGQIVGLVAYRGGLASFGADLRLRLWDADGTPGEQLSVPAPASAMATDGRGLFLAAPDGTLRRVEPDTEPQDIALSSRPLLSVATGEELVATGSSTGEVWLLNPDTLEIDVVVDTGQGPIWALAIADDTFFTAGNDGLIRRWTLDGVPLGDGNGSANEALASSRGAEVFRACAVCHALTPEDVNRAGPTLHGIFGRQIGTAPGYDYSEALRNLDIVWTPKTVAELFEFGPEAYTPGSRMPEQRVPSAADRQALVEFLEEASQ